MANRISNSDLYQKIVHLEDMVKDMYPKVSQIWDWKNREDGAADYRSKHVRSGGSFNWGRVIELLVQGLVTAIAIIGVLLGVDKIK